MPAVATLLETAVAAINAASLAGSFSHQITAIEDFAATVEQSQLYDLRASVQPGFSFGQPGDLIDTAEEELSIRVVISVLLPPDKNPAVKVLLALVEKIGDVLSHIPGREFLFVDASPEDETVYDADRLRDDGVFHSVMLYEFQSLRRTS